MRRLWSYIRLLVRMILLVRNWPVYFFNRCGLLKGDVVYTLWNGLVITSRPFSVDGGALNDVWFDDSYNPNHFGIPFQFSACRTIVDIGANIGTFTLYAAYAAPHARIVAVEPEPGNIAMLQRNVATNNFTSRVEIVPAAIGGADGTAILHRTEKISGGHSLYHHYGKTQDLSVDVVSLASIFRRHGMTTCDFLKLDCEGGEYDALYALHPEELHSIRFLAVECHRFSSHPTHTQEYLTTYLASHGFTITPGKKSMFFASRITQP